MIHRIALRLPCAGLGRPVSFDFISDIHLRDEAGLEEFRRATNAPANEILLLGGDYSERRRLVAPLFEHCAARYRTVLAVLGNNDHCCRRLIERETARHGVRLLCDEIVVQDGLPILGAADPAALRPSLPALPPPPCLVLAHSPDILLSLPEAAPVTILAGHVHGGQIRIPGLPWWSHTEVGRRYGDGLARRGANVIFTGRGLGCSLMTIRNVPREIYEVTLHGEGDREIMSS